MSRQELRLKRPILLSHAQGWQKREANARAQVIPAAGHCANMDNPVEFNRTLQDFLLSQS